MPTPFLLVAALMGFREALLPFKMLRQDVPNYGNKAPPLPWSCVPWGQRVTRALRKRGWRLLWVPWHLIGTLTMGILPL